MGLKKGVFLAKLVLMEYLLISLVHAEGNRNFTQVQIKDDELFNISQKLWDTDRDRLHVQLAIQGKVSSSKREDNAPQPLCVRIPKEVYTIPIYKKFIALFDNYDRVDAKPEKSSPTSDAEVDDYLMEVMKSGPMCILHEFLTDKGLVSEELLQFKTTIKNIWFTLYKRSNALSSSGVEHVQIGEIKGKSVSGFHNWVRFCVLEHSGHINYLGHTRIVDLGDGYAIGLSMNWDQYPKPVTGFFVGTSPAFDLAVYTLCFYVRPNKKCKILINNHIVNIKTHTIQYNGKTFVGTAYPEI